MKRKLETTETFCVSQTWERTVVCRSPEPRLRPAFCQLHNCRISSCDKNFLDIVDTRGKTHRYVRKSHLSSLIDEQSKINRLKTHYATGKQFGDLILFFKINSGCECVQKLRYEKCFYNTSIVYLRIKGIEPSIRKYLPEDEPVRFEDIINVEIKTKMSISFLIN